MAKKTTVTTKPTEVELKVEEITKESASEPKVRTTFSHLEYCNLISASEQMKFVADLRFKGQHKKTEAEWKNLFTSEGLI